MVNVEQGINVLLGSGGISTEARRNTYRELTTEHFSGCSEVLFLPYASRDHSDYSSKMRKFLGEGGANLVGIETKSTRYPPSSVPRRYTWEAVTRSYW